MKGEPVAPVIRANSDASLCDEALRGREIGVGIDGETDAHRAGTLPSRGQFHRQGSGHLVEKGLELCLVDVVLRDIRRGGKSANRVLTASAVTKRSGKRARSPRGHHRGAESSYHPNCFGPRHDRQSMR